jgi:hypothetical protein
MKKGVTFITSTDNPSKDFFEKNFVKFLMNLFDTFAAHCISIKLKAIVFFLSKQNSLFLPITLPVTIFDKNKIYFK